MQIIDAIFVALFIFWVDAILKLITNWNDAEAWQCAIIRIRVQSAILWCMHLRARWQELWIAMCVCECIMPYRRVCTVYLMYMISLNNMYVHVTTELTLTTTQSLVVSMQATPRSGDTKFAPRPTLVATSVTSSGVVGFKGMPYQPQH